MPNPLPEPVVITGDRKRIAAFVLLMILIVCAGAAFLIFRTENTRHTVEKVVKPNLCQLGNEEACVRLLNRLCREQRSCRSFLDRLIDAARPEQKRRILRTLPSLRRQLRSQLQEGSGDAAHQGTRRERGPSGRINPRGGGTKPDGVSAPPDTKPTTPVAPPEQGGGNDGGSGSGGGGGQGSSGVVGQVQDTVDHLQDQAQDTVDDVQKVLPQGLP